MKDFGDKRGMLVKDGGESGVVATDKISDIQWG